MTLKGELSNSSFSHFTTVLWEFEAYIIIGSAEICRAKRALSRRLP